MVGGALQPYAWGRHNALLPFKPDAEPGPHAELWFGTHPTALSPVVAGASVSVGDAPLLMKILAAATPLSIQVHPDRAGIDALSADSTTSGLLSDTAVKDEALIAVEPFDVLAGFREHDSAQRVFAAAGDSCADVRQHLASGDVLAAVRTLLTSPRQADTAAMCVAMDANEARIMRQVLAWYEADRALLVAFLLQPRTLQPGEAMFLPAGGVHAYVNGLGVEVMTSSDNVLRLGLTPKNIAVKPALAITRPGLRPIVMKPDADGISTDLAPFAVAIVKDASVRVEQAGSVALAFDGHIVDPDSGLTAHTGQAFLLHTDGHRLDVHGTAYLAWPKS